jgi:hypothetical protein
MRSVKKQNLKKPAPRFPLEFRLEANRITRQKAPRTKKKLKRSRNAISLQ